MVEKINNSVANDSPNERIMGEVNQLTDIIIYERMSTENLD